MYPDTLLQWLGYITLVFGVLMVVVLVALWIHEWGTRPRTGPHPENPDDEIPKRIDDLPD